MKTKFVNRKEFINNIQTTIHSLQKNYEKSKYCMTDDFCLARNNTYHHIARLLKTSKEDRQGKAFCSLLFKNLLQAETISGGAAEIGFNFALKFANEIIKNDLHEKNEVDLLKEWDDFTKSFKEVITAAVAVATKKEIEAEIIDSCLDEDLAKTIIEAINLAGLEGKIVVQNGKQEHYIIELKNGYNFELTAYSFFLEKEKIWNRRDCKIFIVDGFIENVSELDQILTEAHETKQPVALISQGFSEEVVATLYTNFKSKKLDIMPLRLKADINNLNVLNDIGIVTGKDPLSSLKGEMITFAKLSELPSVERIIVAEENTTIENLRTQKAVLEQIRGLLNKRQQNQFVEDVQMIYEKRIKSLSPTVVTINLPEMSAIKADAYKVYIDNILRKCKTYLSYGFFTEHYLMEVVSWDNIGERFCSAKDSNMVNNKLEEIIYGILISQNLSDDNVSTLSYYIGIYLTGKTMLNLLCSSGFIELDLPIDQT